MAKLLEKLNPGQSDYVDRRFGGTMEQYYERLRTSKDLYIGNLSFYTTEEQVHELFRKCGPLRRIVMGLDNIKKTPCGFCFVMYRSRPDAEAAVRYLNGTVLDGRPIRVDFDYGFEEGRQLGRGRSGGQVRDEFRIDYDEGRGGFGRKQQLQQQSMMMLMEQVSQGQGNPVFFSQHQGGRQGGARRGSGEGEPSSKRARTAEGSGGGGGGAAIGGAARDGGGAAEETQAAAYAAVEGQQAAEERQEEIPAAGVPGDGG